MFRNHGIRPNDGVIADMNAADNDGTGTDFDTISDHGPAGLIPKAGYSESGVLSDDHIIANGLCNKDHAPEMIKAHPAPDPNRIGKHDAANPL